jgi:hypothetical protein
MLSKFHSRNFAWVKFSLKDLSAVKKYRREPTRCLIQLRSHKYSFSFYNKNIIKQASRNGSVKSVDGGRSLAKAALRSSRRELVLQGLQTASISY